MADSKKLYPRTGDKQTIYLKNAITDPSIHRDLTGTLIADIVLQLLSYVAQTEPTEQECKRMREEIEEAKQEKNRAYHRAYSKEYRAKNLEKHREYERVKTREYRTRKKAQTALQPAQ